MNEGVDITRPRRAQKHGFMVRLPITHTALPMPVAAGRTDTQGGQAYMLQYTITDTIAARLYGTETISLIRQDSDVDSVDRRQR